MEIYKKWLSIAMIFILSLSLLSPAAVAEGSADDLSSTTNHSELAALNETHPSGYATVSVEKFTLGQGYYIEPIRVPFYEGEMVGQVIARLLGSGNYNDGSSDQNISYLGNIKDNESTVNIPQYIQSEIAENDSSIGGKTNANWLGQFDYTDMSGWMYTVNHEMPDIGMSEYEMKDNNVIRLQFTVFGYGLDLGLGSDFGKPYIESANKDALTAKVAEINSALNNDEILANANVKSAYDTAYELLVDMESSQENVDLALIRLNTALNEKSDEIVKTDKTDLQTAITDAEANKATVTVGTDGKDIDPTNFWVTQEELKNFVSAITAAQTLIADEAATQEVIDAKTLALNQATLAFSKVKKEGLKQTLPEHDVEFTIAPKALSFKLYDELGQLIDIGEGTAGTYKVYTAKLPAGNYHYEGFDANNKNVGGGQLTITDEPQQKYQFRQLNFKATNSNWTANKDYAIKVGQNSPTDTSLKLGELTSSGQVPVLALANQTYFYQFEAKEQHKGYVPLSSSVTVTISTAAQSITGAIPTEANITFTVPEAATLFVGTKIKHFVSFQEVQPATEIVNANGTKSYSYKLAKGAQYNYRVSEQGKLTNTGIFNASDNATLEITEDQLNAVSPKAILNKGTYLEGNIYLNINPQNHLILNQGDSFKLLPLRSWQALIEGINNYFFEPDFHYEIITGNDVVAIEPGEPGSYATIKALKNGTAIVKVTYDALKVNGSTYIKDAKDAFSAIWPENVGLFVVTVGQGDVDISTGIESNKERNVKANEKSIKNLQNGAFDADIDSVYFVEGERGAYYTFTPEENSTVSILRPQIKKELGTATYGDGTFTTEEVRKNADGSFTILLTEGRNIVKVEKDGKAAYQVMTARPVKVTIDNVTNPGKPIVAGNKVKVKIDGISFPANKLSGIYNFNGQLTFTDSNNNKVTAKAFQYNLVTQGNELTFTIPENHVGEFVLQDGHIAVKGFGSAIGAHRDIDPLVGANPNFAAISMESYYSIFPQIPIISEEKIDTTALQVAITDAETNKVTVAVSTDGKEIDSEKFWIIQSELDAYVAAITAAQLLLTDESATQEAIDAKTLELKQATATFNDAKKAGVKSEPVAVQPTYEAVSNYLVSNLPTPTFGSEWVILALARGGFEVPTGYYDTYYDNVVDYVKGVNGELHARKYTEYSRLILALTAIGKDPRNVGGYNIVEKLYDFDNVVWQGVNGAYFGLIALDTWGFELTENATTTRQKLVDYILSKQLTDGGFALSGTKADPDMTAMAIQSLAPYYNKENVKVAIDRAITTLATMQKENGSFASWGTETAESVAQVITALSSLGIDVVKDDRFNKALSNMMSFYSPSDGGFKHTLSALKSNGMATEQVGYTLAAYIRLVNGQSTLYNMLDTKPATPTPDLDGESDKSKSDETDSTNPNDSENPTTNDKELTKPGNTEKPNTEQAYGYTTFSIAISSSEVPLAPITTEIFKGETAFDVLKRVTAENGISLSYRTTGYGVYVDGINGLFEFDKGPESGWMYRVNGVFPSYSSALYTLQPGDRVEWLYTTNLGKDVGGYVEEIVKEPGKVEQETKNDNDNKQDKNESEKEVIFNEENNNKPDENKETNIEPEKDRTQEENKKPEEDKTVIEEDSKQTSFTVDDINHYVQNKIQTIVIQDSEGAKLEIPTSTLSSIELKADEKIVATVTTEGKQINVNLSIEAENNTIKGIATGKAYTKVTIPATDVTANTVVLQLVNGEYKAVPHTIVDGELIILTKTSGTFVVTEEAKTFKDITKTFNKEEIEFLANRHVIQGINSDEFRPNKYITRAQFAVMISRALGLQASEEHTFSDTKGKWYEQEVQALFEAGITTGKTVNTFDPSGQITRQQAAAFMARLLAYVNFQAQSVTQTKFKDAKKINAQYKQYIELLNSLNIMTGKADGTFDPQNTLTRAQMAKILKRTLNVAGLM